MLDDNVIIINTSLTSCRYVTIRFLSLSLNLSLSFTRCKGRCRFAVWLYCIDIFVAASSSVSFSLTTFVTEERSCCGVLDIRIQAGGLSSFLGGLENRGVHSILSLGCTVFWKGARHRLGTYCRYHFLGYPHLS